MLKGLYFWCVQRIGLKKYLALITASTFLQNLSYFKFNCREVRLIMHV
jgi:hypothetical protein